MYCTYTIEAISTTQKCVQLTEGIFYYRLKIRVLGGMISNLRYFQKKFQYKISSYYFVLCVFLNYERIFIILLE